MVVHRGARHRRHGGLWYGAAAAQRSRATTPGALIADLRRAKVLLDEARPTAVNLSWAAARMLGLAEESHGSVDAIRAALLRPKPRRWPTKMWRSTGG